MKDIKLLEYQLTKLTLRTILPLAGEAGSITTLIEQLKYCSNIRATIGEIQIESSWQDMCDGCGEMHLYTAFRLSSDALKSAYQTSFSDFSSLTWAYVLPTPSEDTIREFDDDANIFITEGDIMFTEDFDKDLADDLINFLIDLSPYKSAASLLQ